MPAAGAAVWSRGERRSRWIVGRQRSAASSSSAAATARPAGPSDGAMPAASAGPAKVPAVPPAATKPYRRRACALSKLSAITLQKMLTTNRLKTLIQTKNERAMASGATPAANSAPKTRKLAAKKRQTQRHEAPRRQPRGERAVGRHGGEHDDEGGAEQPRQVGRAAGQPQRVAQRPQQVVARRAGRRRARRRRAGRRSPAGRTSTSRRSMRCNAAVTRPAGAASAGGGSGGSFASIPAGGFTTARSRSRRPRRRAGSRRRPTPPSAHGWRRAGPRSSCSANDADRPPAGQHLDQLAGLQRRLRAEVGQQRDAQTGQRGVAQRLAVVGGERAGDRRPSPRSAGCRPARRSKVQVGVSCGRG